ncbi:MAG TPA: PilN domain-containing protein [Vicinamibacteria bacterium]|nr:PilN domain-containing protein [Vicinamibacteria bacterium]
MSPPLNLARRPFRNERLPTLALAAGCVGLALATAWHALVARDLAPRPSRDVASEVVAIEKEIDELRVESVQLRKVAAPPERIKEWTAVKRLVDRRMFSWTGLFAALEEALPPAVRLVSVSPTGEGGQPELRLVAVGRSNEDALALMASLQAHPQFEGAFLNGWTEGREGFDITCTVRYTPRARPAASGARAAEPPPEAGP